MGPLGAPTMQTSDFSAPRETMSRTGRVMAKVLEAGVLVPISRTLEWAGGWPRLMGKMPKPADFGSYLPTSDDVIVCSYFKSGTTWVLQMAIQIAHRGDAEFDNIHFAIPWPDAPPAINHRIIPLNNPSPRQMSPTGLRVIKTHYPAGKVPQADAARYVAVVRDPKDVCISGYHFLSAMMGKPFPSLTTWVEIFLSPEFMQGCWATHLASYWSMRDKPNVLFLTYEEMKADTSRAIDLISRHMGVDLADEERQAVAERSSFAWMKQNTSSFNPGRVMPWGESELSLVRSGNVGSAKTALTPTQRERIDSHFMARLDELGCDFPYRERYS